ncbi:MAG: hypothetical protein DWQ48_07435 [Bacteroidetes bacterium]|nr:MAG: hypothetical protein DWQ48_07435 [Bacteroidota bacterium]
MLGNIQFSGKLFSNFQFSERVPIYYFYRRLKQELNLDFLYKETRDYYGSESQPSIDPVVFFKLILGGISQDVI